MNVGDLGSITGTGTITASGTGTLDVFGTIVQRRGAGDQRRGRQYPEDRRHRDLGGGDFSYQRQSDPGDRSLRQPDHQRGADGVHGTIALLGGR